MTPNHGKDNQAWHTGFLERREATRSNSASYSSGSTPGLVDARSGDDAGWSLTVSAHAITLGDVYEALRGGPVLGHVRNGPDPDRATLAALDGFASALEIVRGRIEEVVVAELRRTTVADLLDGTPAGR